MSTGDRGIPMWEIGVIPVKIFPFVEWGTAIPGIVEDVNRVRGEDAIIRLKKIQIFHQRLK